MNHTLGPKGIVPSTLIFGEFPTLRSVTSPVLPRPSVAERSEAAQHARRHLADYLARAKFKRALHHNPPPASDITYPTGGKVLVWREKQVENRIGNGFVRTRSLLWTPHTKLLQFKRIPTQRSSAITRLRSNFSYTNNKHWDPSTTSRTAASQRMYPITIRHCKRAPSDYSKGSLSHAQKTLQRKQCLENTNYFFDSIHGGLR